MQLKIRLAVVFGLILNVTLFAADTVTTQGSNIDPNPGKVGKKPYEMADREEERVPLTTFEDCDKWVVESQGAEASLYRTTDQRLYRDYCGKLVYTKTAEESEIFVRLKDPIDIPGPWNCVNFWNYGAHWLWGEPHYTRALHISAVIKDAKNKLRDISFDQGGYGGMVHKYWFMNHAIVTEDIVRPAKFVGFRFSGKNVTDAEALKIYLGPVYFYKEESKPLKFEPWPEKLSFPTRKETILPTNKTNSFSNTVTQKGDDYFFAYRGSDCELSYRVSPAEGGLNGVAVLYGDKVIYPCKKGGLKIAGVDDPKWEIIDKKFEDDKLTVLWKVSTGDSEKKISYKYHIMQKSLVVEMQELGDDSGIVEKVELGEASPVRGSETVSDTVFEF